MMGIKSSVAFVSRSEFFIKERDGRKPNTIRKVKAGDKRFKALREGATHIVIVNAETGVNFIRAITDYSEFEGIAIISWKHIDI